MSLSVLDFVLLLLVAGALGVGELLALRVSLHLVRSRVTG